MCFGGEKILTYCPWIPRNIVMYLSERSWKAGILAFILGNQISAMVSSTGAFEIFVNETNIWSKLATGTIPNLEQLIQSINNMGYTLHRQ